MLITLSTVLGYVAAEIYLPAMPTLQEWFGSSTSDLQLTVSVYILGLAISQLIGGPVIDRLSYRYIAITMCVLFIISSIACALSADLYQLIIARLFQAFSGGLLAVIGRASLSRLFKPDETMRIYLYISPILALSLSFSPLIGGYLTHYLSWHSIFYFTALLGFVLFYLTYMHLYINDSKSVSISISPKSILKTYYGILSNKNYLASITVTSVIFAQLLSYLTESPFIFGSLNYTSQQIGKFYILLSLAFVAGSWFTRRYIKTLQYDTLVYTGFLFVFLGIALLFTISLFDIKYAYEIYIPSTIIGFGNGILIPIASGKAITVFPDKAGYASGLLSFTNLLFSSIAILFVNLFTHKSTTLLAVYMGVFVFMGLICFYYLNNRSRQPTAETTSL